MVHQKNILVLLTARPGKTKYPIHFLKCHLIYLTLFIIRNNILELLNTPTYLFLSGICTNLTKVQVALAKYLVIHELFSV